MLKPRALPGLARDSTTERSWRHIALVSMLRSSYASDAPLTSLSPSRADSRPGPRRSSRAGGALRGGLGCERGRQAEIDDRERYRRGAALSCCGTRLSLRGGRGGPCRRGICQWPRGRLESKRRKTAAVCRDSSKRVSQLRNRIVKRVTAIMRIIQVQVRWEIRQ